MTTPPYVAEENLIKAFYGINVQHNVNHIFRGKLLVKMNGWFNKNNHDSVPDSRYSTKRNFMIVKSYPRILFC